MATREGTKPNEDGICNDIDASMATVDEYNLMIYCIVVCVRRRGAGPAVEEFVDP